MSERLDMLRVGEEGSDGEGGSDVRYSASLLDAVNPRRKAAVSTLLIGLLAVSELFTVAR